MASNQTYRVLVVLTNVRMLHALAGLIRQADSLEYAGCAANAQEALALVRAEPPDLVLTSASPTTAEDVIIWRKIRALGPHTLILSTYLREDEMILSVLSSASGHLLATAGGVGLSECILRAARGESLMPAGLMTRMRSIAEGSAPSHLDERERLILGLVLDRAGDSSIAESLGGTESEVSNRIWRVAHRLTTTPVLL